MSHRKKHYTHFWSRVLISAGGLCSLTAAGCWEKVYYTGSSAPPDAATEVQAPREGTGPVVSGDAAGFGDELAAALASRVAEPPAWSSPRSEPEIERSLPFPATTNATVETATTPIPDTVTVVTPPAKELPKVEPPAAAVSITPEATAANEVATTRRAAWLLGSRWSLAALARERGAPEKDVADWLALARRQADILGTSLSDLPPPAGPNDSAAGAPSPTVKHLIAEGQRLGRDLTRFGPDRVALFELAVKSNLLLVLYGPGSPTTDALVGVIVQSRERAGLPAELVQPLLTATVDRGEPAAIRQAVFRMHDEVGRFLDAAASR